jgi:hypothetical protein
LKDFMLLSAGDAPSVVYVLVSSSGSFSGASQNIVQNRLVAGIVKENASNWIKAFPGALVCFLSHKICFWLPLEEIRSFAQKGGTFAILGSPKQRRYGLIAQRVGALYPDWSLL